MFVKDYYLVFRSLYTTKYHWRTLKGISKELNMEEVRICKCLNKMFKRGILYGGTKQPVEKFGNTIAEHIYCLCCNYEKQTSFSTKLLDAIRGRIIR